MGATETVAPVTLFKVTKMAPLITKTNGAFDNPPKDTWDAILFQFSANEDEWFISTPIRSDKPQTFRIITDEQWRISEIIDGEG